MEVLTERQKRHRRDYFMQIGRPQMVGGEERDRAVRKIRSFKARGMSFTQMELVSGVPPTTLHSAATKDYGTMHRRVFNAVARMRFEEPDPTAPVSALGAYRRSAALWRDGFTLPWLLANGFPANRSSFSRIVSQPPEMVFYRTAKGIAELYDRLDGVTATDAGIDLGSQRRAATYARKKGLVPRHCWDPDTLDDPKAFPEWTGACGTRAGRQIHRRENIPMCQPCELAELDSPDVGFRIDEFRRRREALGLSQYAFAEVIGVDRGTVAHWETGRNAPRASTLVRVLSALDCTRDDLYPKEE